MPLTSATTNGVYGSAASLSLIGDPPDGIVSIFAHEKCAVFRYGESHRTTPYISLGRDEPCQEILLIPPWFAVIEGDAHYLIARAFGSIPGAVEGDKGVATIRGGKLFAVIENHVERG